VADAKLPEPSAVVMSGGGLHVYWISDKPLTRDEWQPYASGLWALVQKHGLKADALTTDAARVLRVPGTFNRKTTPPKEVKLQSLAPSDHDFESMLGHIREVASTSLPHSKPSAIMTFDPALFPKRELTPELESHEYQQEIGLVHEYVPLDPAPVLQDCPFMRDALHTGGKNHDQGLWMMTVLATSFCQGGQDLAHSLSKGHARYSSEETDAMWDRKVAERDARGLGWPSCETFEEYGSKFCAACPLKGKIKSPLNLARPQQTLPAEPSFADPYAEFVGPAFPLDVLPPTLSKFVDAEYRAMGADPAAIVMAVLTTVAGAMHAETRVLAGEGWWEHPILWTALVGQPSTKKSPIIDKATKPLSRIDHERDKAWRQEYEKWQKNKAAAPTNPSPAPAKPPRCIINDATPEKVAEILSRSPGGSFMVHDELAGWLDSFERYNSGQSSRAFYLSSWNGGPFLKDRVGKGKNDLDAEIRVDNLALCTLGGIQPDKLAKLGDLTSDGLLQRFLSILMRSAERGDEYHPVAQAESDYEKLIKAINDAPPQNYHFADDAFEVRERVNDYLHKLEGVDGFSSALIGAIGKLKGYFARICLVLHVARQHDPLSSNEWLNGFKLLPDSFTRAEGERLCELLGVDPNDLESLSAGISGTAISRRTAEAAEMVLRRFLLPHILGFYDLVVNGGQDRDKLRSIGDFILASDKNRLRPSDLTAGVRTLRGLPEQKIREWVGRFCAMDWLQPEEERPGVPPKAWLVVPGLREHFAERRKLAEAARAEAHAILKAGGSRRSS